MKKNFLHLIGFLIIWGQFSAWPGGSMLINKGTTILWPQFSMPIQYVLDKGGLGPLNHAEAIDTISKAFSIWQTVDNSWLKFSNNGEISSDVTGSNYSAVMNSIPDTIIPVVFDQDGSVVEKLMGSGSKNHILGFASPIYNTFDKTITGGTAVFNGWFFNNVTNANGDKYSKAEILSTIIHEFGHICGLDHSQIFRDMAWDGMGGDDIYIPIMFPTNTDNEALRQKLTFDDSNTVATLYSNNPSNGSYGKITGKVVRGTQEMPGVNVIARKVGDPFKTITSTVTGTYAQNGAFEFSRLPAGDYELWIEPIYADFNKASSVGQYAGTTSATSFKNPVKPEFYNTSDKADESRSLKSVVTVRAGQTTANINFIAASANLTTDEREVELLALDSTDAAGAGAGVYSSSSDPNTKYVLNFMLDLDGTEKKVSVAVEFDASSKIEVDIKRESSSAKKLNVTGKKLTAVIGNGGDAALQKGRYFISVANGGSTEHFYTITTSTNTSATTPSPTPAPTLTPTPTPSFTPTPKLPTATKTPTKTPTPKASTKTPSPTLTPTPTPTIPVSTPKPPTSTPTPGILSGDVNGDGIINGVDIFGFASDWYKSSKTGTEPATSTQFYSNLSTTGDPFQINLYDLLILREKYQQGKFK